MLQLGLGLKADSAIGPATLEALATMSDRAALVERIHLARVTYYRGLSTFPTFGRGWINRLAVVAGTSVAWAAKT